MPNEQNQNPAPENNKTINRAARHNARRYALQAMYQWQLAGTAIMDLEHEFLRYHMDKPHDLEYFKELIHGIPAHQDELDREIKRYLERPFNEVDPVELAVLRLAVYEMLKRPDVPYRVIINEALELTKKFGSVDGFKFVNSILDKIAKKTRADEINMSRS